MIGSASVGGRVIKKFKEVVEEGKIRCAKGVDSLEKCSWVQWKIKIRRQG